MTFRSLLAALVLASAGPAPAQDAAPAPAPDTKDAPAQAAPDATASAPATTAAAPPQRCHKEYRTGSNLPKTVCESASESDLERMRIQALEDLKHRVQPGLRAVP
jgi:hypothetical protein